jgi:hypothetical protein
LENFRSFSKIEKIELKSINVFIGANNSGKSSIIRALYLMQDNGYNLFSDVRFGCGAFSVNIGVKDIIAPWSINYPGISDGLFGINVVSDDRRSGNVSRRMVHEPSGMERRDISAIAPLNPYNFIVPFLSRRKTSSYDENVSRKTSDQIRHDMSNLAAKLSKVSSPSFHGHDIYADSCKSILGFVLSAVPSENGQYPGIYFRGDETLTIDQMGEGVPNIACMLADLASCRDKLFLIEEPENDLHPKALKALLALIVESSKNNQFVISTHSSIVLSYLGACDDSCIYSVCHVDGSIPAESSVSLVDKTPSARLGVLQDLGYSFSDFELWDGWLILEESSAESLIVKFLIPWFVPGLKRLRTLSASGADNVDFVFNDFKNLVLFTHLEAAYKNAAWVRVDGDEKGCGIVNKLKSKFSDWDENRFSKFEKDQFEYYYPEFFADQISSALSKNGNDKRAAKKELLCQVMTWLDENEERGKEALGKSAKEIIDDLRKIEGQLKELRHHQASEQRRKNG